MRHHGPERRFAKDGRRDVTTCVPAEAVRLIAQGWLEITDEAGALPDPQATQVGPGARYFGVRAPEPIVNNIYTAPSTTDSTESTDSEDVHHEQHSQDPSEEGSSQAGAEEDDGAQEDDDGQAAGA